MRASVLLVLTSGVAALGCSYPDPNGEVPCTGCVQPNRPVAPDEDAGPGVDSERPTPDPSGDSGAPAPTCSPTAPFGAPALVAGIDPERHGSSPHLTPDERVIFFTGADGASSGIFRASRAARTMPFGPAELVPGMSSASNDNDPSVSADGLTLVFHSGRSGNNDVWWATRADAAAEFGAPEMAPGIATEAYEGQGFFHVATDELWFVSNRLGTYDLFRAKRAGGTFGAPVAVAELNTTADEFLPFLSQDGLTLYFSSTRPGGVGGQDLYLATRSAPGGTFGAPVALAELNTDVTEQAGSLSPDNCRIYFSRQGGPGGQQLFVAERPTAP